MNPQGLRQSFPWDKVQDGLYAWVVAATGLPVFWARLAGDGLQPPRAYASIDIVSGPVPLGLDGVGQIDLSDQVPAPAAGQELASVAFGLRSLGVEINIFSDSKRFADAAMSYATGLVASLRTNEAITMLQASGLAARNYGSVRNLSEFEEAVWVSRALVEIEFSVASWSGAGSETGGYVNEVIGAGAVKEGNPDGTSISAPIDAKVQ